VRFNDRVDLGEVTVLSTTETLAELTMLKPVNVYGAMSVAGSAVSSPQAVKFLETAILKALRFAVYESMPHDLTCFCFERRRYWTMASL
jgi:hypothetical protein